MTDFFRRMQQGTVINFSPDDGGAPDADPAAAPAGGAPADPDAGSPPADTGTAADGTPADGTVVSPAADAPADGTPPATTQPDAQQRRMNQLVAERWAERRRAEESEQRNRLLQEQLNQTRAALQTQPQVDANGNPVERPAAPVQPVVQQQDIQRMAADIAANNDFNRQVAEEVTRGRGVHQDFDQVASALQQFGELPRTFVQAALATGKGADVMYALGKDPLEASRILTLGPMEQAVALAGLAHTIKAPVPAKIITEAPRPVTPKVGGGKTSNTPSLEDPNISTADWISLREKQLAANKGTRTAARR